MALRISNDCYHINKFQSLTYICKLKSLHSWSRKSNYIPLYMKKDTNKHQKSEKNPKNFLIFFLTFLTFFILISRNREEFTKLNLENESRNREDHEFWNHEMRGSPVVLTIFSQNSNFFEVQHELIESIWKEFWEKLPVWKGCRKFQIGKDKYCQSWTLLGGPRNPFIYTLLLLHSFQKLKD